MLKQLRAFTIIIGSLGLAVLFSFALPTTALADSPYCSGIGGTCAIPCPSGSHPAIATDFVAGASNDCPLDPDVKLHQFCCIAESSSYQCTSNGGSCDSGSACASGKTALPYSCAAGSVCCKATASGAAAASACPACSSPSTLKDSCGAGEAQNFYCSDTGQYCCTPLSAAVQACASQGGSCKSSCDSKTESTAASCQDAAKNVCCVPLSSAGKAAAAGSAPVAAPSFGLQLPSCISDGNCQLSDIVDTGANAANFFTTLAAALFFLSFVYGGARYLLSFGRKEWVSAGTKAMTTSALGMAIVMFAWVIVNYVANALQGKV